MITKTKLRNVERGCRRILFHRRTWLVWVWSTFIVFFMSLAFPGPFAEALMKRCFPFLFGFLCLLIASSYSLTAATLLLRRDYVAGLWMSILSMGFAAFAVYIIRFAIS